MGFDLTGLGGVSSLIETIANKIWPDKTEQEKAKFALMSQELAGELQTRLQQMITNTEEAKHASWFVAGWRPAVGWVCAIALGYHYVLAPFFVFLLHAFNVSMGPLPSFDMGELMPLLTGMLGFGALRTYEKIKKNGNGK